MRVSLRAFLCSQLFGGGFSWTFNGAWEVVVSLFSPPGLLVAKETEVLYRDFTIKNNTVVDVHPSVGVSLCVWLNDQLW